MENQICLIIVKKAWYSFCGSVGLSYSKESFKTKEFKSIIIEKCLKKDDSFNCDSVNIKLIVLACKPILKLFTYGAFFFRYFLELLKSTDTQPWQKYKLNFVKKEKIVNKVSREVKKGIFVDESLDVQIYLKLE